jgi:hypothetical protein
MDEKGFACGGILGKTTFVVVSRGYLLITRIELDNRKWITSLEFVTVDGVLRPAYILDSGKVVM